MNDMKKKAKEAVKRGRDTAMRVGKVAKSAAVAGAKAGASAALAAGTLEAERSWKATKPMEKMSRGKKVAAVVAGAVALGAVGVAVSRARRKKLDD
jgi:hypothetical protein